MLSVSNTDYSSTLWTDVFRGLQIVASGKKYVMQGWSLSHLDTGMNAKERWGNKYEYDNFEKYGYGGIQQGHKIYGQNLYMSPH